MYERATTGIQRSTIFPWAGEAESSAYRVPSHEEDEEASRAQNCNSLIQTTTTSKRYMCHVPHHPGKLLMSFSLPLKKIPASKTVNSAKTDESTPPETPAALRKSFKRLFGDTLSDSDEEPEEGHNTALFTPDVSISEPPSTSTPVKSVTSTTVYEYDRVDSTTQTEAVTPSRHQWHKCRGRQLAWTLGGKCL